MSCFVGVDGKLSLWKSMLLKRHLDQLEAIFLRQFEDRSDGIIYRRSRRGAPIPVTEGERNEFARQYRSATRFRGQSLTVDSDLDSRLAFGGSLGRADWRYGRRVGSDRAAAAT